METSINPGNFEAGQAKRKWAKVAGCRFLTVGMADLGGI